MNFANRNVFGIDVYYLTGEYEQKSSDFPNLLLRDNAKNHKRLWDGAKIIKTSLTDSLELANYLSGLTISTPQVLIVPTGCYDYAVESIAREIEGLTIIEDHNNMQFSLTSWEDDLWKLAKDAYAQLNEITQLSPFTSIERLAFFCVIFLCGYVGGFFALQCNLHMLVTIQREFMFNASVVA